MAGADVRDILELAGGDNDGPISKKDIINSDKVREDNNNDCWLSNVIFLNILRVVQAVGILKYNHAIPIALHFEVHVVIL